MVLAIVKTACGWHYTLSLKKGVHIVLSYAFIGVVWFG
jgi:hypothetical protein